MSDGGHLLILCTHGFRLQLLIARWVDVGDKGDLMCTDRLCQICDSHAETVRFTRDIISHPSTSYVVIQLLPHFNNYDLKVLNPFMVITELFCSNAWFPYEIFLAFYFALKVIAFHNANFVICKE